MSIETELGKVSAEITQIKSNWKSYAIVAGIVAVVLVVLYLVL